MNGKLDMGLHIEAVGSHTVQGDQLQGSKGTGRSIHLTPWMVFDLLMETRAPRGNLTEHEKNILTPFRKLPSH